MDKRRGTEQENSERASRPKIERVRTMRPQCHIEDDRVGNQGGRARAHTMPLFAYRASSIVDTLLASHIVSEL